VQIIILVEIVLNNRTLQWKLMSKAMKMVICFLLMFLLSKISMVNQMSWMTNVYPKDLKLLLFQGHQKLLLKV